MLVAILSSNSPYYDLRVGKRQDGRRMRLPWWSCEGDEIEIQR